MRSNSLIFLLTIIVLCLVHFDLGAMDSKSVSSLATTPELKGNPGKNIRLTGSKNSFSKGNRTWQSYASAAAGDSGKGDMYALHLGYGYFMRDFLSVNIDVLGGYIRSGIDDEGVVGGLDVLFRRHFPRGNGDLRSVHLDLGGGLQQQSTKFSGGRHFNFRIMVGGGGTLRVSNHVRMTSGVRYLHISDAGIKGGGGGFDGFMFHAGAVFLF